MLKKTSGTAIYLVLGISISQALLLPLLMLNHCTCFFGRNTVKKGATICLYPFLHTYDNSLLCCLEGSAFGMLTSGLVF